MWYFGSKYLRIRASVKVNRKRLKAVLALKIKNFGLFSIASKLIKFPIFGNFFPDLAKFWDLDVFSLFDFLDLNNFPNFLVYFILFLPTPNLLTSPLPMFLLETSLLLSFLLKADLLLFFLLGTDLLGDSVIFSIEVNKTIILLKL